MQRVCDQGYSSSCPRHLVSEKTATRWARAQTAREHQNTHITCQYWPFWPLVGRRRLAPERTQPMNWDPVSAAQGQGSLPPASIQLVCPSWHHLSYFLALAPLTQTPSGDHRDLLWHLLSSRDASLCSATEIKCPDGDLSNRRSLLRALESGSPRTSASVVAAGEAQRRTEGPVSTSSH